jgi:hypothetical protein
MAQHGEAGDLRRVSKGVVMRRVLALYLAAVLGSLTPSAQAAEATTGSAHAGAVFTSATATYIVRIDVERGFFTDPLGEPEIVKQVLRCRRGTSDCALVAQEAGPLQDGESFTLGTDHRARLKARWLGYPLVVSWDRYDTLPPQAGTSLTYSHDNWSEQHLNYSSRFLSGTYMMLGSHVPCRGAGGVTITSLAAAADRSSFVASPLPLPATLLDLRRTKGRCQK